MLKLHVASVIDQSRFWRETTKNCFVAEDLLSCQDLFIAMNNSSEISPAMTFLDRLRKGLSNVQDKFRCVPFRRSRKSRSFSRQNSNNSDVTNNAVCTTHTKKIFIWKSKRGKKKIVQNGDSNFVSWRKRQQRYLLFYGQENVK